MAQTSGRAQVTARAALITGGSSGIGLAIARALGEDGYGLTVSARRPDKLEAAAAELRGDGLEVEACRPTWLDEEDITAPRGSAIASASVASTCW